MTYRGPLATAAGAEVAIAVLAQDHARSDTTVTADQAAVAGTGRTVGAGAVTASATPGAHPL